MTKITVNRYLNKFTFMLGITYSPSYNRSKRVLGLCFWKWNIILEF